MGTLVLLRHGQSIWNAENRFAGWVDVDLSLKGKEEARLVGENLLQMGISLDYVYTSLLTRAIRTAWLVLDTMGCVWVPTKHCWRLNERHYGALQGQNKAELSMKYGELQVLKWRYAYNLQPPALAITDDRHPSHDLRYANVLLENLPNTESPADAFKRLLPYWEGTIFPTIKKNQILIVAHASLLRVLITYLENLPKTDMAEIIIPTGTMYIYHFENNKFLRKSPDKLRDDAKI